MGIIERNAFFDREQVFQWLKAKNYTKAVVSFSGGGDEGGVDRIELYKSKEGEAVEVIDEFEVRAKYSFEGGKYTVSVEDGKENDYYVQQGLSKPVYDKYGSFAGEFQVDGEVIWDVEKETVVRRGEESEMRGEEFEEII